MTAGAGTPEAATTHFAYDLAGNLITSTDPLGRETLATFDTRNRRVTTTDPLGHTTAWTYDAAGNVLTEKRPDGGLTSHSYDSMDRLVSTTDPKNQITAFTYHPDDNLASLTDARNNTYTFEVDLLGRRTKFIYPGGSYEQWTFNDTVPVGQIASIYRARNGATMSCILDNRNRDLLCDWSDTTPDTAKTYDAVGRLLTLQSSVSNLSYTYDAANQLLSETQSKKGQSAQCTIK